MIKISQYRESDPKYVAEEISKIVRIIISRMSVESQNKSRINIKNRVLRLNPNEMTIKKSPAGASIGTSIALIKNMPKMSVISRTYLLMFGKKLNSALFLAILN